LCLAINTKRIRRIPEVIAIAGGVEKADVILAAYEEIGSRPWEPTQAWREAPGGEPLLFGAEPHAGPREKSCHKS